MQYMQIVLLLLALVVIIMLMLSNYKIKKELKILKELLAVKDTTISNLEASRVAVKDVLDNISMYPDVMKLVDAQESREAISKKLNIDLSRVELIVKLDKIKKEKQL
jgi:hypothetical protein